jgi:hypothetical protein
MTEEFLQYLWKFRLLNQELHTRSGETLTILHPGEHNHNGGPDFINARIRIANTIWAGNVEVHMNEADWFRHGHHLDKTYENVILHVVYEEYSGVSARLNTVLPTLILQEQYPEYIYNRYQDFLKNRSWIPCEKLILKYDHFYFDQWSPSLLIERLENRSAQWAKLLEANKFDWAETLHQSMARSFGLRINTVPFELLAKVLPLKLVLKYKNNPFTLESLAFGQAGMLNINFSEEYPESLKKEYSFLAGKHSIQPIDPSLWKFLRLRPPAFPTIRIAQWAAILQHADIFFSSVLECKVPEDVTKLLSVGTSEYWNNHFVFDKPSSSMPKFIGTSTIHLHILNAIAPFIYFYGDQKGINDFKEKAIALFENIPAERNSIIGTWHALGFPVDNALKTQALIQLKSNYCDRKRCLDCRIGSRFLGIEGMRG